MSIDLTALRDELATDPQALGYTGSDVDDAALLVGCDLPDVTALEQANDYAEEVLGAKDPVSLDCGAPDGLPVDGQTNCGARNGYSEPIPPWALIWDVEPDSVADVQGSLVTAEALGTFVVTAYGPTTSASDTVTVQ